MVFIQGPTVFMPRPMWQLLFCTEHWCLFGGRTKLLIDLEGCACLVPDCAVLSTMRSPTLSQPTPLLIFSVHLPVCSVLVICLPDPVVCVLTPVIKIHSAPFFFFWRCRGHAGAGGLIVLIFII